MHLCTYESVHYTLEKNWILALITGALEHLHLTSLLCLCARLQEMTHEQT